MNIKVILLRTDNDGVFSRFNREIDPNPFGGYADFFKTLPEPLKDLERISSLHNRAIHAVGPLPNELRLRVDPVRSILRKRNSLENVRCQEKASIQQLRLKI